MAPGTTNFILFLVILIYTSPPIFIKIGPKLTKLAIGVVGVEYTMAACAGVAKL